MRWQVRRPAKLSWRRLGDEWVVYEAYSGLTTQLPVLEALVLIVLEDGEAVVESIARDVATELEIPIDQVSRVKLTDALESLDAQGLVEVANFPVSTEAASP